MQCGKVKSMKRLIPLTALAFASVAAAAEPQISAQSIIVNPIQTPLKVSVWTDRDPSGTRNPGYRPGERIKLYVRPNQNAYIYLFNIDPNGKVDMILPNRFPGGANYIRANQTKQFPGRGDQFTFDIAAPYGTNKVLALASESKLNMNQIASFSSEGSFATSSVKSQDGLAQALSIVVKPIPQKTWVTNVAYYNVAYGNRPTPTPPVSNPSETSWHNTQSWRKSFALGHSLTGLYTSYDKELRNAGYVRTTYNNYGSYIRAYYKKGNRVATLKIFKGRTAYTVMIDRK